MKEMLKRNSATIFTVLAVVGVVATAIFTAKETPKAIDVCSKVDANTDEPTSIDYAKAAWKCYVPAVAIGTATIACIFASNSINKKQIAALAGAYGLVSESYKKYKNAVKETYGENAHQDILRKIVTDKTENNAPYVNGMAYSCLDFSQDEDIRLFYDNYSGEYFESTFSRVLQAEYHLNRNFMLSGAVSLNDFYDFLGLEEIKKKVKCGDVVGWSNFNGDLYWIDFDHTRTIIDDVDPSFFISSSNSVLHDGLVCYVIDPVVYPDPEYLSDY